MAKLWCLTGIGHGLRSLPDTAGCVGGSGSDISLLQVLGELQRWEPVVVTVLNRQQVAINSHT